MCKQAVRKKKAVRKKATFNQRKAMLTGCSKLSVAHLPKPQQPCKLSCTYLNNSSKELTACCNPLGRCRGRDRQPCQHTPAASLNNLYARFMADRVLASCRYCRCVCCFEVEKDIASLPARNSCLQFRKTAFNKFARSTGCSPHA